MTKKIYLAGGCFWGLEKYIALIPGVTRTETGYANGRTDSTTYQDIKNTGHAETVLVEYDPAALSLAFLLDVFYTAIDPTSVNKQGADEGEQYRTGIYYEDESDIVPIAASMQALWARVEGPIAIESRRLENYCPAEDYHQKYLEKNPAGYCHISSHQFEELRQFLKQ